MKKIAAWFAVILMLVAAIFSPMANVYAAKNASDAKASGQYEELLEIYYWLQEVDSCIKSNKVGSSGKFYLTGNQTQSSRQDVIDYYNLNFDYDSTKLYDGYLETTGQGSYKNGSVYCKQLTHNPPVNLMRKYGLYTNDGLTDLVCGKNNEGGLFKIRLGTNYQGNEWRYIADSWPSGWAVPENTDSMSNNRGYVSNTDCRATFDKIRFYANSPGTTVTMGTPGASFYAEFYINDNFSFADYFKEYTGDLSSVNSGLMTTRRYLNFVNACKTTKRTKDEYDAARAIGAGNYYRIYHNGATEYWSLEEPGRTLYLNNSLTDSSSTTCQAAAEALAPGSSDVKAISDSAKLIDINNCYDTAQDNIEKLKEVQVDVGKIYDTGSRLLTGAKALKNDPTYNEFRFDFGNGYAELMRAWARPAGGGDDLNYFIDITADFENTLRGYHGKTNGGSLTQGELNDLSARIDNYEKNLSEFKSNVYDAVNNKMNELPKLSLSDVAVYSAGNGYIKNKVDNFYEINVDTGELTCTANSVVERIRGEIASITGGTIGFTAYEGIDRDEGGTNVGGTTAGTSSGGSCKTAAKSMGWLLCTILEGIGNGVEEVYTKFVEPNLILEPTLFVENGRNGTKQGWDVFRNIANVAIIILFLAVIFSQLTGVGIDNYGIKKILPKLILVAILMNLSYYMCVALVDVSNIAGSGVQNLFNGLRPSVGDLQSLGYNLGSAAADVVSVALLGTAVAGVAWGFSLATLLALIPTAISVLVSIFFLFILLAAREAAVVVMIVLSPLAFACFILPNTKKIFDRWLKIGEALLLVYPIAGLLVAGGNYVSRILLSSGVGDGGIVSAITAMLVGVVPIFFIPSVLKNSMSGLGNIGNKISSFGSKLGRGAGNRVANNELFKMQQQRANESRARKLAGLKKNEKGEWVDSARGKFAKTGFGRALGLKRMQDRYRGQANSMETARRTEEQMGELGVLNAQRIKDNNMLMDRAAEAEAGVPVLNESLARQRAQARRSSQELKNYQDQYATFSKAQLTEASKGAFGDNGWLSQQDGSQRMAALMGAMINNGMEDGVAELLESDKEGVLGQEKYSSIRQMLAGVKEKHLKAYGKGGAGVSYTSFMEDLVDVLDSKGQRTGRRATRMQQYIDKKGNDFYKDLSDKALQQLQKHGGLTNAQVIDVVSRATSQDAINVGDEILRERMTDAARTGEQIKITGNQLAALSPSTISTLNTTEVGRQAILEASQDLIRNNRLQTGIDSQSRQIIDQIRSDANQGMIWTASEKRTNAPVIEAKEYQVRASARAQQAAQATGPEIVVNPSGSVSGFEEAYRARTSSTAAPVVETTAEPGVSRVVSGGGTATPYEAPTFDAEPIAGAGGGATGVPEQFKTMGIGQLFETAGMTGTSDLDGVENAIMNYQGSDFTISESVLPNLKLRTINKLASSDNPTHRQALISVTDKVASNPAILGRLSAGVKARLNTFRIQNGLPPLQ